MNYYNFNLITFIHCDQKTVEYEDVLQSIEFMLNDMSSEGLTKPCIMDIKIGAKTYGPDANQEKIAKQDASYSGNFYKPSLLHKCLLKFSILFKTSFNYQHQLRFKSC